MKADMRRPQWGQLHAGNWKLRAPVLQHPDMPRWLTLCPRAVDEQLEGMRLNEHAKELGKQAGVLSKQAASNLKKGFASLAASVKEIRRG